MISNTHYLQKKIILLAICKLEILLSSVMQIRIIILQMPIQTDTMNDGQEEDDDDMVNQEVSDLGYINGDNDSFIEDPEIGGWDQSKIE